VPASLVISATADVLLGDNTGARASRPLDYTTHKKQDIAIKAIVVWCGLKTS